MTEVVFGPVKPPTTDWRWQEVLTLEPFQVMEELKELDDALFAARSELKEAARELAEMEETLYRAKQESLEAVMNGTDQGLADSLFKGGTKDERAQKQENYLLSLDWVQKSEAEIKAARMRKDNAQVAFDSLLDRQTNLGKFANMYSATARLLANIHVEPDERKGGVLYFVKEGAAPISVAYQRLAEIDEIRRRADVLGYEEVDEAAYQETMVAHARKQEDEPMALEGEELPEDVQEAVSRYQDTAARKKEEREQDEPGSNLSL